MTIRVSAPFLGDREVELVAECVRSGWVSSRGAYLEEFEREWAGLCGRRHGVAVCNGTAALELGVRLLELDPGDEIIMPTFTIISCALAAIRNGCVPVLVDCDPSTWCVDVSKIEDRISSKTRAIMPVHVYGHPVDMDPLLHIADRYDLRVVEDAAEAHGAAYLSRANGSAASWVPCGGMGDVSAFSFYANKLVTTGEGGMLVTDDDRLASRARSLRNLAFGAGQRFVHDDLGFNFRMTNLQAALGVAQISRFEETIQRKRAIADRYTHAFERVEGVQLPSEKPWARSVYWMYGIVLNESLKTDSTGLSRRLAAAGIETRPFFLGIHQQPALRRLGWFGGETYPEAERIARGGLYLPSGPNLRDDEVDLVIDQVLDAIAQ